MGKHRLLEHFIISRDSIKECKQRKEAEVCQVNRELGLKIRGKRFDGVMAPYLV